MDGLRVCEQEIFDVARGSLLRCVFCFLHSPFILSVAILLLKLML